MQTQQNKRDKNFKNLALSPTQVAIIKTESKTKPRSDPKILSKLKIVL